MKRQQAYKYELQPNGEQQRQIGERGNDDGGGRQHGVAAQSSRSSASAIPRAAWRTACFQP